MASDFYVNFDKNRRGADLNAGEQILVQALDRRSNRWVKFTNQCGIDDLFCNYIDMYNSLKNEFKSQIVGGHKYTQFGYLEFGLVPIVFLPINVFTFELEMYNKMLKYLSGKEFKYYILPAYDFIRGYHIYDQIHNDIWMSRKELAKMVGKSEEVVSAKDFIRMFMEEDFVDDSE